MASYKIFKDDGKLNLEYYANSSGKTPKEAIKKALKEMINPRRHKGHWVAIPSTSLMAKNKHKV